MPPESSTCRLLAEPAYEPIGVLLPAVYEYGAVVSVSPLKM